MKKPAGKRDVALEVTRARRAVDHTLALLGRIHGDDTVRAAVNRWLTRIRKERAAQAVLTAAEQHLRALQSRAVRRA